MRMYLSSFRNGDHPEHLLALLGTGRRTAVLTNACDAYPAADREAGVEGELSRLRDVGLEPREVDLRRYFGEPERLRMELASDHLIWVRGGNTFVLRHALAESGADDVIRDLLARDGIAYGGYSAGVCVLTPSLRGLEIADTPSEVTGAYGALPRWDGLGVLDWYFVPHYRSPGHPETEACERLAEHYEATRLPHRKLRDGQVIVIDGPTDRVI